MLNYYCQPDQEMINHYRQQHMEQERLLEEQHDRLYDDALEEESNYERIFSMLLMSGEFREQDIDAEVHQIMDNPSIYPEYF